MTSFNQCLEDWGCLLGPRQPEFQTSELVEGDLLPETEEAES